MSSPSSLFLRRSNSLKTLFFSFLYTHSTTFTRQIQSRKASLLDILVGRIFGKSNPNLEHLIQTWGFSDSRFCIISRNMGETSTTPVIENIENGSGKDISETISNMGNMGLEENGSKPEEKKFHVIFVLGGPGSGKGTQCANIVETFGFTHLSAGDLLRAEIKSGSENGNMIETMIKEGKIVPSEVTVKLLQKAMNESGNDKFLIDGFPRNEENRAAFENVTGIQPDFVLFFDCPEEEMEKRLLGRNQGRVDDNIDTIRKRFKVFIESSLPVISYYETKGKVRKVDAVKTKEEVFDSVKSYFASL